MTSAPQVTAHGGGVWSIPVPIPDNPLGHTLVHVLDTDSGPVLIDTGWDDPDSWQALADGLAACGTAPGELHGVIVTHHHPDHHGLSARVREESGAWIAMHAADAHAVRRAREVRPTVWLRYYVDKLAAAGAPESHTAPLREALAHGWEGAFPGHRAALPDREIPPGELLEGLPGRRLRAIWTPGHTPGHVCLHLEERHGAGDRLFSGDHLLPTVTPHIGLYEDPAEDLESGGGADTPPSPRLRSGRGDPLGDYLASLERVARLAPAQVLPAHEYAFAGARERADEIAAHHAERLSGLRTLLAERPRTPWELAEAMRWNRPWADIPFGSRNIAVAEAEAHLRHLVKLGLAEPVPGGEPVSYRATAAC
ncbi:MBL fold metallo-hydrolase [Streptomyces boncukensis]|uniref:MBL fold metallo-hydrolase n=1 Tax=Streptomyces boncukensis TaxID=2711219 RepID=A0A6G4X0Z8_9ACTN|nr:MBL fold metallo-hydrolase [Streptomyces boncukensis]NGO71058.1 MBL fold metallo-hydrolase [Streptomyces boncukensis]